MSEASPPALGHYRQFAVAAGETIHVAGQVSVDETGTTCGIDDPDRQANQVAANLRAVLADAGLRPAHVVSLRVYAVSTEAAAAWAGIRTELFPTDPPASTLLYVSGLASPDFLLEVDAIAAR